MDDRDINCMNCAVKEQEDCCEECDADYSLWRQDELTEEPMAVGKVDPNGIDAHAPGAKLDFGKNKWYLLPWKVIEGVAAVMTFGANKYSENGWQDVPQAKERYFAAMMRHWMLMNDGEYADPDSGLPHWAHFCCNAVFLGYFHSTK